MSALSNVTNPLRGPGLGTAASELGHDHAVQTARGERAFAAGDRLMFLSNERSNLASLIFQEVSRKPKLASLVIANADG